MSNNVYLQSSTDNYVQDGDELHEERYAEYCNLLLNEKIEIRA